MLDLKPCPFCGNSNVAQGVSRGRISVWCRCGAQGPDVAFPEICIEPAKPIRECHELWNRRTLSTITPAEVGGLVDELRCAAKYPTPADPISAQRMGIIYAEAATALEAQSAELVWRRNQVAAEEARADDAETALTTERAAHAETQRELARAQEFERQHDYCCCGSRMDNHSIGSGHSPVSQYEYDFTQAIDRAEAAETRLAEAMKALEPFADAADDLEDDHKDTSSIWECPAAVNIDAGHLRAARRVREGGKVDG